MRTVTISQAVPSLFVIISGQASTVHAERRMIGEVVQGIDFIFTSDARGEGTPLYGLYRYVRPQRVGFFSRFGHK